jgi:hypothetical protein
LAWFKFLNHAKNRVIFVTAREFFLLYSVEELLPRPTGGNKQFIITITSKVQNQEDTMKKTSYIFILGAILLSACVQTPPPVDAPADTPTAILPPIETLIPPTATITPTSLPTLLPNSVLVNVYDPARDPAEDLRLTILIARQENKRILLELGGDWCIWCKYLDTFFSTHEDILQFRAGNFVFVKVNVSSENKNLDFLAQFPEPDGYPHIFVLDSDGTLLHSQDTGELEQGRSYNPEKFMAFLKEWALAH